MVVSVRIVACVESATSATIHICTTLQQHCGISLLHEQGYTAEVLGVKLGVQLVLVYRKIFGKVINKFGQLNLYSPLVWVVTLTTLLQ